MICMTIRGGATHAGPSVDSIVRREYGPTAEFWPSRNRTSPEGGVIVSPVGPHDPGTYNILAAVLDVEEVISC